MRDTQKNIQEYREQLKFIKEKMATALLLFLVACTMMTTTTFAWIVLSVNPEVKGITTSVSGNGNLEIALASPNDDGLLIVPEASQVGDSKKDLLEKNVTWGNLINLNDDGYGLSNIVLRPAQLNPDDPVNNPLVAIVYGSDGRYHSQYREFKYSYFSKVENKFIISNQNRYGVRAISSVQREMSGEAAEQTYQIYLNLWEKLNASRYKYKEIVTDTDAEPAEKRYLSIIAELMGVFLQDKLSDADTNVDKYTPTLYSMIIDFNEAVRLLGETYVEIVNLQIVNLNLSYSPYSLSTLLNESESSLKSKSITLVSGFDSFKKMYNDLNKRDDGFYDAESNTIKDAKKGGIIQHLEVYKGMTGVKLSQLLPDINFIVDINSCVIDDDFKISEMASQGLGLLGMLSGTHKGTITKGVLKDFEKLTGERMAATNMKITVNFLGKHTLNANIYTDAEAPFTVPKLIDGDGTANDFDEKKNPLSMLSLLFKYVSFIDTSGEVYGMTLDLWFRTNVANSYLVLEGKPIVEYQPLINNNGYLVYVDKETDDLVYHVPGAGHPAPSNPNVTLDYIPDTDSDYLQYGTFYSYTTNQEMVFTTHDEEGEIIDDPVARAEFVKNLKYAQKSIVVGYDGVNRVWEETTALIDGTSTTQGKGSCFIFYPEDPIEQERMLKLLNAVTIAFVDTSGKILSTANLNSANAFEEAGKITVPLELNQATSTIVINSEGEEVYSVMPLEQNVETYVSAIIYLDGTKVENKDVSVAKNINGYLNLQFGSTVELNPQEDEAVQQEYIVVTGSVDRDSFTADELPASTNLTINIAGTDASNVKVNFVRKVNNFQGIKMADLPLTISSSGDKSSVWTASQTFTTPGTYVLRNVWVDGIEYELEEEISVDIPGLNITSIGWNQDENEVYMMSSENRYTVDITANISTSELLMPSKIEAMFRSEDNEYVNINMSKTSSNWEGRGVFTNSGTYTLEFLKIDGQLYSVDPSMQKIIHLTLGIYADVRLDKTKFDWDPVNKENNAVTITGVRVFDNSGNIIQNLSNMILHYNLSGNYANTLTSPLTWDSDSRSYKGKFIGVNPGVYEFYKLNITTPDSVSEIRRANAQKITAISPFSPELDESSLSLTPEYQFAPGNNASFMVKIKNSNSATLAGKFYNHDTKETLYFEAPQDKSKTEILDEDSGESMTTWYFYPKSSNKLQDGKWDLQELYITNVYYDGTFHSKAEGDEWWSNTEEGSFITWDVGDVSTNILTKINVTITDTGHVNGKQFNGSINESLTGSYQTSGYEITYQDQFKNNIFATGTDGKTIASKYGVSLVSNELTYTYKAPTAIIGESGYWTSFNGAAVSEATLQSELAKQVIDFNKNKTYTFYYPGEYQAKATIKFKAPSYSSNDIVCTVSGTDEVEFINVTLFNSTKETVTWLRPDIIFSGTVPAVGTNFNTWNSNFTSVSNSIDATGKTATIFTQATNHEQSGGCAGIGKTDNVTFVAPEVTMQLVNIPSHNGVTCIINNTRNASGFKTNPTFNFDTNSQEKTVAVAKDTAVVSETRAQNVNYNNYRIGDHDFAQEFTVTYVTSENGNNITRTYTFNLNGNLAVNYAR